MTDIHKIIQQNFNNKCHSLSAKGCYRQCLPHKKILVQDEMMRQIYLQELFLVQKHVEAVDNLRKYVHLLFSLSICHLFSEVHTSNCALW